MSFPRLIVEHNEFKDLGTGIVINETVKDTIILDDDGNQTIQEVARLSVIWENVKNPAINYHSADELEFKGFYDDIDNNDYPIEQVIDFISELSPDHESINTASLINALKLEFGDDEDEEDNEDEIEDNMEVVD